MFVCCDDPPLSCTLTEILWGLSRCSEFNVVCQCQLDQNRQSASVLHSCHLPLTDGVPCAASTSDNLQGPQSLLKVSSHTWALTPTFNICRSPAVRKMQPRAPPSSSEHLPLCSLRESTALIIPSPNTPSWSTYSMPHLHLLAFASWQLCIQEWADPALPGLLQNSWCQSETLTCEKQTFSPVSCSASINMYWIKGDITYSTNFWYHINLPPKWTE